MVLLIRGGIHCWSVYRRQMYVGSGGALVDDELLSI